MNCNFAHGEQNLFFTNIGLMSISEFRLKVEYDLFYSIQVSMNLTFELGRLQIKNLGNPQQWLGLALVVRSLRIESSS